jgi:hypothetical protein
VRQQAVPQKSDTEKARTAAAARAAFAKAASRPPSQSWSGRQTEPTVMRSCRRDEDDDSLTRRVATHMPSLTVPT